MFALLMETELICSLRNSGPSRPPLGVRLWSPLQTLLPRAGPLHCPVALQLSLTLMPPQRQTTNNLYFGLHLFPAHSSDNLGISWSIRAMGGSFVIIIFGLLSSVPEIASEPSRCNGYLVIHSETLSTPAGFMLMRWLLEVGVLVARGTNQKRGGTFSPTPWSPGRGRAGGWLSCRWFNHDLISRACVTKIPHKPQMMRFRDLLGWGTQTLPCATLFRGLALLQPFVSLLVCIL